MCVLHHGFLRSHQTVILFDRCVNLLLGGLLVDPDFLLIFCERFPSGPEQRFNTADKLLIISKCADSRFRYTYDHTACSSRSDSDTFQNRRGTFFDCAPEFGCKLTA